MKRMLKMLFLSLVCSMVLVGPAIADDNRTNSDPQNRIDISPDFSRDLERFDNLHEFDLISRQADDDCFCPCPCPDDDEEEEEEVIEEEIEEGEGIEGRQEEFLEEDEDDIPDDNGITDFEDGVRAGRLKNVEVNALPGEDNTLDICRADGGVVNVVGKVVLNAIEADLSVNILCDTIFRATYDRTCPLDFAEFRFHAAKGRTITVNLDHNLTFTGSGTDTDDRIIDMLMPFSGQGQTVLNFADGKSLKFTGDVDRSAGIDMLADNGVCKLDSVSNNAGGTKVFITMEQTKEDYDNGFNKVLFRRKKFAQEDNRVMVFVGPNSLITYLSDDVTGSRHETRPTSGGFGSIGFDVSNRGIGRMVLFVRGAYMFGWDEVDQVGDPLFTQSDPEFSQISKVFPYNDGAVVIAGHKVDDFSTEGIVNGINYSIPAGGQARIRVLDDRAYNNRTEGLPFAPDREDHRGLLVINDAQSVSSRAADPYLCFFKNCPSDPVFEEEDEDEFATEEGGFGGGFEEAPLRSPAIMRNARRAKRRNFFKRDVKRRHHTRQFGFEEEDEAGLQGLCSEFAYSSGLDRDVNANNVRRGFVLGINGAVDVNHATFFDYVAGSVNKADWLVQCDNQDVSPDINSLLMGKNPSAFVVDGLDSLLFQNNCSAFKAGNPFLHKKPRRAELLLRGDAQALFRVSASASLGYIREFWRMNAPFFTRSPKHQFRQFGFEEEFGEEGFGGEEIFFSEEGDSPIDNPAIPFTDSLIVGIAKYDGLRLLDTPDTSESGQNVIEVEGTWQIKGFSNSTVRNQDGSEREYAQEVSNAGSISTPTIEVDHTGCEVVQRPLIPCDEYTRYESPRLFLNNNLMIENAIWCHSDLTKTVTGIPTESVPAFVGGERMRFAEALVTFDGSDRDRWRFPEFRLFNAELQLKESLAAAGMRFVVRSSCCNVATDNISSLRFVDQGREEGQIFQLGSTLNRPLDLITSDWITESAYLNVFRVSGTTAGGTSGELELQINGGQLTYPEPVRNSCFTIDETSCGNDNHRVVATSLPVGTSNITAGSAEIVGQTGPGLPYRNTRYQNPLLFEPLAVDAAEENQFSLDAAINKPATITVARPNVLFAGFDQNGDGPVVPVRRWDNNGVINVGHGGAFAVEAPGGVGFTKNCLTSCSGSATFLTNVVQRVVSGCPEGQDGCILSGQVNLPSPEATFAPGFGVQLFGIDAAQEGQTYQPALVFAGAVCADPNNPVGVVRTGVLNVDCAPALATDPFETRNNQARNVRATRTRAHTLSHLRQPARSRTLLTRQADVGADPIQPIERPASAIAIGPCNDIQQLVVSGATPAQPCDLVITGDPDDAGAGRVREIVSGRRTNEEPSDDVNGEGLYARVFLERNGRLGLGSTQFNQESGRAASVLSSQGLQIAPLGNGVLDINSDLVIADPQALIATTSFGQDQVDRLTFTSDIPVEIRVPAGVDLDLSSFGKAANRQEIAFGGRTRLIFEKGSNLRFPSADQVTGAGVVLYMNDQSELIFEGETRSQISKRFSSSEAADAERIHIYGAGQIWANKDATISVDNQASVGVQADICTPTTDLTISLQRQAQMHVGTDQIAGGSFEVGNPFTATRQALDPTINFTLITTGREARFLIGRGGFVGLGAGIVNKGSDAPNGSASPANNPVFVNGVAQVVGGIPSFNPATDNTAWTVQPLSGVLNIGLQLDAGCIDHHIIVDGSDSQASLLAVGPANSFSLALNALGEAQIRGGGNMMFVPANFGLRSVNIWDFAGTQANGERYGLLGVGPSILDRARNIPGSTGFIFGRQWLGLNQETFFNLISSEEFNDQSLKVVPANVIGRDDNVIAGWVIDDTGNKYPVGAQRIVRDDNLRTQDLSTAHEIDASVLKVGGVRGLDAGPLGPTVFDSLG